MQLPQTGSASRLLDTAFRRAKRAAAETPHHPNRFRYKRQQHAEFVSAFCAYLVETLGNAVRESPDFSTLDPFTRSLATHTADLDALKQAMAHLQQTVRVLKKIKHASVQEIFATKHEQGAEKAFEKRKRAVGRLSSALKKAAPSIRTFNEQGKKLRELPVIDKEAHHVALAGYPNAGKTTLLQKLTKSTGKIATYPFTTTRLNIGHYQSGWKRVEVIDTPGLLDRAPANRNAVERKAASALRHVADEVVFVADPTEAEYTLDDQRALLSKIKKEFNKPTHYYISRTDAAKKEQVDACRASLERTGATAFAAKKRA